MNSNKFNNFIKWRWLIALIAFILCLIFKLHGSSIGMYNTFLPTVTDQKEADKYSVIGTDRAIRSDEWAVQVPTFFSQYYNDYNVMSEQMSVGGENMILDYFAPVKSIVTLGKPLNWGYLFFGNEVGLSWYWCGQLILLFMTAFELFMILTNRCVKASVFGSFMIALSPCIQWWFLPHMPIVFLYGMALFDIGYYFFTAKKKWLRWLMTIIAGPIVLGFALSIFPSCQVPVAIIVVVLLIMCLIRDKRSIEFSPKQWYRIAIPMVFVCISMGYFIINYSNDLMAEMNTVYPGKRVSVGGDNGVTDLFTALSSIFLPYRDINVANNSEASTFIQFAPFFIVLFPKIARFYREKDDRDLFVGKAIFIMILVQVFFMCAGFTTILSQITFFKYINRMKIPYGWLAVIFTVWCIYAIWKYNGQMFKKWEKILYPCLFGGLYCTFITDELTQYVSVKYILAEIVLFVFILISVMIQFRKLTSCLIIGVMCIAGITVNPIRHGISPITNHPISQFIESTSKNEPDAKWIAVDVNFTLNNFIMANGAQVVNGTNFLPDFDKWKLLDKANLYEESWNRYAHQLVTIVDDSTSVALEQNDSIHVYLNVEDLKKMDIEYVFTQTDILGLISDHNMECDEVFEQDGYHVYQISYN